MSRELREIKFRGLGIDGKWWYGGQSPKGENHVNLATFFANAHAGAISPDTLGEYTGLKDKNGKEIYEGDIVGFKYNRKLWKGEVAYGGCGFWIVRWSNILERHEYYQVGVIGNIYEHPDLLRKGK